MSGKLNITERLAIPPDVLLRAMSKMEIDKYVLFCERCQLPMRHQTILMAFEFGSVYATEYYCIGNCGNRMLPVPQAPALGKFIGQRDL